MYTMEERRQRQDDRQRRQRPEPQPFMVYHERRAMPQRVVPAAAPPLPPALLFGPPFSATRVAAMETELSTTGGRLALMEQMMQPAAKAAIKASLFDFLSSSGLDDPLPSVHMDRAVQIMEQYKSSERIVQLGLAVWKAMCILEMPDCGYHQTQEWMKSGWKTRKAQQRDANAMSIILPSVKEFLD